MQPKKCLGRIWSPWGAGLTYTAGSSRRSFVLRRSVPLAVVALSLLVVPTSPADDQSSLASFSSQIAALENEAGGCVGVAALNTADGKRLEYNADRRFAMCSTFKLLLAAAVFSRIDRHADNADRHVTFDRRDLEQCSPMVGLHVQNGFMTVLDLCAAAVIHSDNSAANLLLQTIGGPTALTAYLRTIGDSVTRLDRTEPSLNSNLAGDNRDTTTPRAMLDTMQKVLLSDLLSPKSRQQLQNWLAQSKTGLTRLRSGINPDFRVGDKSGSGDNGATNDVAIVWPKTSAPFLIAAYYTDSTGVAEIRDLVLARVARIVSQEFGYQ